MYVICCLGSTLFITADNVIADIEIIPNLFAHRGAYPDRYFLKSKHPCQINLEYPLTNKMDNTSMNFMLPLQTPYRGLMAPYSLKGYKYSLVQGYRNSKYVYGEVEILNDKDTAGYIYNAEDGNTYIYGEIDVKSNLIRAYDGTGKIYLLNVTCGLY
jgi:hypothetical protein